MLYHILVRRYDYFDNPNNKKMNIWKNIQNLKKYITR